MRLFRELRRRHVFRVAGGYLVLAWAALQVTDVLVSLLELPNWVGRLAFFVLLGGFPLAILASWVFEFTSEGIKRESVSGTAEIRPTSTGRVVDFAIIAALTVVLGYFVWDKTQSGHPPPDAGQTVFQQSIAVLPVRTVGGDESSAFFAAGLHDILLAELAKIANLKVISRRSVMPYAESEKGIREIANELNVRHVVEASVQRSGGTLRVIAQLVEAETENYLWAETFNEAIQFDSFFEVQAEIVARIGASLETALLPNAAAAALRAATSDQEAYRDYVAAISILQDADQHDEFATPLLQSAVEKDPDFALAWVHLADRYQQDFWWQKDNRAALEQAENALARARELQPELPELHLVHAKILYHGYLDYDGALEQLELAEKAMPGSANVYHWRAIVLRHMRNLPRALAAFERALQLDPRDTGLITEYGVTLVEARRFKDAERFYESAISTFPDVATLRWFRATVDWFRDGDASAYVSTLARPDFPQSPLQKYLLVSSAWISGQIDVALEHADRLEDVDHPLAEMSSRALKALVLRSAGRTAEAQALLEEEDEEIAAMLLSSPDHFMLLNQGARVAMLLGDELRAVELANRAVDVVRNSNVLEQSVPASDIESMRKVYGVTLCHVGEFDEAVAAFRLVLTDQNQETLDSLVGSWPPCRDKFVDTAHYVALKEEFRHLAEG